MSIKKEDGAGGKYTRELLEEIIFSRLNHKLNEISTKDMEDATDFDDKHVMTTDSYVVDPWRFPGGNIGKLAVAGTVNDLSVVGARPIAMTNGLIIQEGFRTSDLEEIVEEMKSTLDSVGMKMLAGDTKVITSKIGILINTTGVGIRNDALEKNLEVVREYREYASMWIRDTQIKAGDVLIISGTIADHATAIMSTREGLKFEGEFKSDVAPLWPLIEKLMKVGGIVAMKDPTRGGIANLLNEWAQKSNVGLHINEEDIPIKPHVKAFCDALGLDYMAMANEGKVVLAVVDEMAEDVLKVLKSHPLGKDARVFGKATSERVGKVVMETSIGTKRLIPEPSGDPIPRVC